MYWKGTTRAGVLAGLIAGTVTTFAWHSIAPLKALIYERVPAFAIGLLATLIASRLTRPPSEADAMMDTMRRETARSAGSKRAA